MNPFIMGLAVGMGMGHAYTWHPTTTPLLAATPTCNTPTHSIDAGPYILRSFPIVAKWYLERWDGAVQPVLGACAVAAAAATGCSV